MKINQFGSIKFTEKGLLLQGWEVYFNEEERQLSLDARRALLFSRLAVLLSAEATATMEQDKLKQLDTEINFSEPLKAGMDSPESIVTKALAKVSKA